MIAPAAAGDVLVVEPEATRREELRTALEQLNLGVITTGSLAEANGVLSKAHPAFIMVGLPLLRSPGRHWPSDIPVVVLTAGPPSVDDRKAAMQFGGTMVLENAAASEVGAFARSLKLGFRRQTLVTPANAKATTAGPGPSAASLELQRPELHDPTTGRIDAGLVAGALGVQLARLARALEAERKAVYKTPAGERLQRGLAPIKRVLVRLSEIYPDPSHQRAWLNQPLDDLEEETPLRVILRGEAVVVAELLEDALVGQPA